MLYMMKYDAIVARNTPTVSVSLVQE
jgi:hypothetical protein